MSAIQDLANKCQALISRSKARFIDTASAVPGGLIFETEKVYAITAMVNNEYLAKAALNNPVSVDIAMAQVAATGLTLDPAMQLAYLVPRDGKVIAEISYRGLIDIAIRSKAVSLVTVKPVYSNDLFRFKGDTTQPLHEYDPFLDVEQRGEFRGAYSCAYLANNMLLVTPVRAQDIYAARELSSAWKNAKPGKSKGPWESHFEAMALKTCVKISRKYWPLSSPVLEQAIAYLNDAGGEGFASGAFTLDMAANTASNGSSGQPEQGGEVIIEGSIVDVEPTPEPTQKAADATPPQQQRPTASQQHQARQGSATVTQLEPRNTGGNTGADGGEENILTDAMRERVDKVIARTAKQGTWKACEDWMRDHLTGAALQYAHEQFASAQAAAQNPQAAAG
ncbi:TPA: recombinase RecT [Pseudomonas aeruginosa]|nr:recombinase RecT [Pseudomonas aeruginosa]